MTAAEIARAVGDARREGRGWRTNCPKHGGHSLVLADGRDGRLLAKCWRGCQWRDISAELSALGLIAGEAAAPDLPERQEERRQREEAVARVEIAGLRRRICRARDLYRRADPADTTPVGIYLRSRSITLPIPATLRYLRHCPHRNGGYYPAMVAPVVNVAGEQIAVHKTFLRPDGCGKADLPKTEQRETCGPMRGGAVRLGQHRPDIPLLVGEGIESTLSAMLMFGLPGWAALCADGIEALELPADIREIGIAADNDEHLRGQRAALVAYRRWTAEGRSARIFLPPNPGGDFNDLLPLGGN